MRRLASLVLALVVGLAVLTVVADAVVTSTTREWFARDMTLRARLAVHAKHALLDAARAADVEAVRAHLDALSHDTRILAAYACSAAGAIVASTEALPASITCADSADSAAEAAEAARSDDGRVLRLPEGEVHLASVATEGTYISSIVLVHDMSFVQRREQTTRKFLVAAFALLALAASVLTVVAQRVSWHGWSREIARLLGDALSPGAGAARGETRRRAFGPVLREVRAVMERLAREREVETATSDGVGSAWTPARLKSVLAHHLQGERVVIMANREPYIHEHTKGETPGVAVLHPASGLVSALEPVMRACSGVWVAHGSGSADRAMSDAKGRVSVPPGEDLYTLRRVWLSPEEERGYYYGFANEGLWPLCHIAHTRPAFRSRDWRHYVDVNERFADAACDEVESDDPIILVQDYHLALAPRLLRERLPRATVITFWHCPWPSAERFAICPYGEELLQGMLGSSIVGFHTQAHCNNFLASVDRTLEARIDREQFAVVQRPRTTLVRPYPISIPWPNRWVDEAPPAPACRASVLRDLGLPENSDVRIGVGVDRIDYIKGIEERFLAVERLLEREPAMRGTFTFVQLGAPSRGAIGAYKELNERVESEAARINARFFHERVPPIVLRRAHHEPPDVFRYLRAADLCYVSSLHDGMNLVAKEFVAARSDERGVLILSEFAGAADELAEALVVNPYDIDEAARAMGVALRMSPDEQADRLRAMRAHVAELNVYRWAGRMLVDAARLRRQERVSMRIARNERERAA
jgi:trehalose 6-phosphate synthase